MEEDLINRIPAMKKRRTCDKGYGIDKGELDIFGALWIKTRIKIELGKIWIQRSMEIYPFLVMRSYQILKKTRTDASVDFIQEFSHGVTKHII